LEWFTIVGCCGGWVTREAYNFLKNTQHNTRGTTGTAKQRSVGGSQYRGKGSGGVETLSRHVKA